MPDSDTGRRNLADSRLPGWRVEPLWLAACARGQGDSHGRKKTEKGSDQRGFPDRRSRGFQVGDSGPVLNRAGRSSDQRVPLLRLKGQVVRRNDLTLKGVAYFDLTTAV